MTNTRGLKRTYEGGVADELASEPEEGLLKVVVGLGRDIVVLEVLLSVEGDGLGLDLSLLDIDLVTAENNGDVLANSDEITWNRFVSLCLGGVWIGGFHVRCQLGTFL
jgi:hypothetical protein